MLFAALLLIRGGIEIEMKAGWMGQCAFCAKPGGSENDVINFEHWATFHKRTEDTLTKCTKKICNNAHSEMVEYANESTFGKDEPSDYGHKVTWSLGRHQEQKTQAAMHMKWFIAYSEWFISLDQRRLEDCGLINAKLRVGQMKYEARYPVMNAQWYEQLLLRWHNEMLRSGGGDDVFIIRTGVGQMHICNSESWWIFLRCRFLYNLRVALHWTMCVH